MIVPSVPGPRRTGPRCRTLTTYVTLLTTLLLVPLASCGPGPDAGRPDAERPGASPTTLPATPPSAVAPSAVAPSATTARPASVRVDDALGRATTVTHARAEDDAGTAGSADGLRAVLTDGVVVVTARLADGDTLAVHVEGARWETFTDGSATLTGDDGDTTVVGGTRPEARDDARTRRTATRTEDDGATLVVTVVPRTTTPTSTTAPATATALTTVTLTIAPRALVSATWADGVEGGRSLRVDPSPFGRSGTSAAVTAVRTELVAAEPEAGTTVMDHQLRCHALGARDKETWNLEPWRPEVGYLDYLLARCNPT